MTRRSRFVEQHLELLQRLATGAAQPPDSGQLYLHFSVAGGHAYLLDAEELVEVLRVEPGGWLPVPLMPPPVMGVLNWRGEMLWLVDLAVLHGLPPQHGQRRGHCHVLAVQVCGRALGLVVQAVGELESLEAFPATGDFIRAGVRLVDGSERAVFDGQAVVDRLAQVWVAGKGDNGTLR